MADLLVSEGYAAAGYEYVNVDDCWLEKSRGSRGELVADRRRFPNGMKALGQYVSSASYLDPFSVILIPLPFRFMDEALNLASTRTMATTPVLDTPESWATWTRTPNCLQIGKWIT